MSKKKWSRKKKRPSCSTTPAESAPPTTLPTTVTHHVLKEPEKLSVSDKDQTKHAYNVALTTAKAAEAAVFAAQAAAEVICLTAAPPASAPVSAGKSKEEIAALKIQTVFRGYMVYSLCLNEFAHLFLLMRHNSKINKTSGKDITIC